MKIELTRAFAEIEEHIKRSLKDISRTPKDFSPIHMHIISKSYDHIDSYIHTGIQRCIQRCIQTKDAYKHNQICISAFIYFILAYIYKHLLTLINIYKYIL